MSRISFDSRLRRFGITLAIALSLLATFMLWEKQTYYSYLYWAAGLIMLCALIYPRLLKPMEMISTFIMLIVGTVIGAAALTIMYYLVLTPVAILLKIFRQETLSIRKFPEKSTYWRSADKSGSASRFDKPF